VNENGNQAKENSKP